MIKKLKNGGMVVIDKSHKALYRTLVSCMEYFNTTALTGFVLVFIISLTHHLNGWCVFYSLKYVLTPLLKLDNISSLF